MVAAYSGIVPDESTNDPGRDKSDATQSAIRQGIAVGVATGLYGISFGALSVAAGFSLIQTSVLSLLMFTGGSQYALVGVITAGGLASAPSAIFSSTLLGSRNALYGMRMQAVVGNSPLQKVAAAWLTIDESVAVSLAQRTHRSRVAGFWATGLAVFVAWNAMTIVGAVLGDMIGDPRTYGLDAAAAVAFLGLIWPRLRAKQPVAVGVGAAIVATVLTPVVTPGLPVIIASVVALIVGIGNYFAPASDRTGTHDQPTTQVGPTNPNNHTTHDPSAQDPTTHDSATDLNGDAS